jgi:hypothetical protein
LDLPGYLERDQFHPAGEREPFARMELGRPKENPGVSRSPYSAGFFSICSSFG